MSKYRATRLLFVTLIIMIVMLPLGSALAVQPSKIVEEFFLAGELIAECDDFQALVDSDYKLTTTEYYDKDGNVKRIQIHYDIRNGQLYNSNHPDIKYPEGPDHALFVVDPVTGIIHESGLAFHFNVPGYGVVAIDAGRAILNPDWSVIWERGQHDYFTGDLDALCSFLAVD